MGIPSGLTFFFLSIPVCVILGWYSAHVPVYCIVQGASEDNVNGLYAAADGYYMRKGYPITYIPDFFRVVDMLRTPAEPGSAILLTSSEWDIVSVNANKMYRNHPVRMDNSILHPPRSGWARTGASPDSSSTLQVTCRGDLPDSPINGVSELDNIGMITKRPITTLLLVVNIVIAYYLWAYKVEVSAVAFSYDAVVEGEYWRMVTASFSHFDLMHIGFNMMSLYQLGVLEIVYSSVVFSYLNIDLVFLTMLICLTICYIRIKKYQHLHIQNQQSIGFSCVLFAWMVAVSVRMNQYCPLFFLPSLCFDTWHIKFPFSTDPLFSLPINLGPFVLLVVTKLILPRTSLVGHFSGIVIGFPVAWNLLNWMTPPVLCIFLVITLLTTKDLWPWKMSGYSMSAPEVLREIFTDTQLQLYSRVRIFGAVFVLLTLMYVYLSGMFTMIAIVRIFIAVGCFLSHHVIRCLWLAELHESKNNCLTVLTCFIITLTVLTLCDVMSLASIWTARDLLLVSGNISRTYLIQAQWLYLFSIGCSVYLLYIIIKSLQATPEAKCYLQSMKLDEKSTRGDFEYLSGRVTAFVPCLNDNSSPFQSQGQRLLPTQEPDHNPDRGGIEDAHSSPHNVAPGAPPTRGTRNSRGEHPLLAKMNKTGGDNSQMV